MLCMMFGQLGNRESLSDLLLCLNSQRSSWYHLGLGTSISKSNLAYANEKRNWRIFADYAMLLIAQARNICTQNPELKFVGKNAVYGVDTTTIDLCLSVFWWAKFRQTKAAVKLHTQLDLKTEIPSFIHISDGKMHEINMLDLISYEAGSFYIMDRGFLDFERLYKIESFHAYFVTRTKVNTHFRRVYSAKADKKNGVLCDQTIALENYYAQKDYPKHLRRIKFFDKETKKTFVFLTNNFNLTAMQIALLYKYRWKIELFFKWIKQHLKVKSFWGHSENAVKIQVYCAIISFLTVAIMKHKLKLKHTQYEILQILSMNLLNKMPINQLFREPLLQNFKEQNYNQLKMF